MLITGSGALKNWFPDFREPKDIDYIATRDEYNQFIEKNKERIVLTLPKRWGTVVHMLGSKPIEFEIGENGNTAEEFLKLRNSWEGFIAYLSPCEIYTFKMSHRYLKNSPHFKKCMDDIINLRKLGYGYIPEYMKDWMKRREKETYSYKHPKLKQSKDSFFSNDGVNYIYDHDTIHECVKTFDRPAFYLIKDNEADVFCSKEKFYSLSKELQLATVIEETYTLALERSQIPFNFPPDRKKSFLTSLQKVCTSITSGWWREFAWEHYYDVLDLYNENYVDRFKDGLTKGIVKPYKGES
jgi:hypothetical protein